jgi:hypothetical protein
MMNQYRYCRIVTSIQFQSSNTTHCLGGPDVYPDFPLVPTAHIEPDSQISVFSDSTYNLVFLITSNQDHIVRLAILSPLDRF